MKIVNSTYIVRNCVLKIGKLHALSLGGTKRVSDFYNLNWILNLN